MEEISRDELFEREERCDRAVRTLVKALLTRLLVALLLLWVILTRTRETVVAALFALVFLLNLVGSLPLWKELKKRLLERKTLRGMEKE